MKTCVTSCLSGITGATEQIEYDITTYYPDAYLKLSHILDNHPFSVHNLHLPVTDTSKRTFIPMLQ